MSSSNDLTLLTLNSDVIRYIIKVGLEDADEMRLISPKWNDLVQELLSNRLHLPTIDYFRWKLELDGRSTWSIRVPEKFRKYFGILKWDTVQNRIHLVNEYVLVFTNDALSLNGQDHLFKRIIPFFTRCSLIKQLDVTGPFTRKAHDEKFLALWTAIAGLTVERLTLRGLSATAIEDLLKATDVKQLVIREYFSTFDDVFPFLLLHPLVSKIPSVELAWYHKLNYEDPNQLEELNRLNLQVAGAIGVAPLPQPLQPGQIHPVLVQRLDAIVRNHSAQLVIRINDSGLFNATSSEAILPSGDVLFRIILSKIEEEEEEGPSTSKKRKVDS